MVFFKEGLCFFLLLFVSKASSSYIHGCYLSNATNSQQQFQNLNLETYTPNLCSHIFFSYAQIKDDFILDLSNPGHLKWGAENKFCNQLIELKSQQPGLKTILSLGGALDLKKIMNDDDKRHIFVQSTANFVKHFEFDGVDIDASQSVHNKDAFTKFVGEFKKVLPGKLIIVSVPADREEYDSNFDVSAIAKNSDFVNIFEDQKNVLHHGSNSKEFDSMYTWVSTGLSKNKLLVGMNIVGSNLITKVDQTMINTSSAFITLKNQWMKENGFGGAFVWLLNENKIQARTPCCDEYPDQEIVNNDLVSTLGQLNECCNYCANLTGCIGWTWDNTNGGKCWFKTSIGPTVTKTGAFTGVFCDTRRKTEKAHMISGNKNKDEL